MCEIKVDNCVAVILMKDEISVLTLFFYFYFFNNNN